MDTVLRCLSLLEEEGEKEKENRPTVISTKGVFFVVQQALQVSAGDIDRWGRERGCFSFLIDNR